MENRFSRRAVYTLSMRRREVRGIAASALATVVFILAVSGHPSASAWGNGGYSADTSNPDYGTHDGIADLALSISKVDVSFLSSTYHTQYLLGTEAPDNPDYVGDSSNHHVYYYSSGQLQDDKSAARARTTYTESLAKLRSADLAGAAFLIGEMTHYISDVGVFGHTMGAGTDWGAEVHHSDYESWFDDMIMEHTVPSTLVPIQKDAYNATLDLARAITFGDGAIKPNVWMDANYDWSDTAVFVPSAIGSLDLAIQAAASAIDHLVSEAGSVAPPVTPPVTPDPTPPDDGTPTTNGDSTSSTVVVGLTMIAVLAVSGILLIRTRKGA
jgi:hypothetical protein